MMILRVAFVCVTLASIRGAISLKSAAHRNEARADYSPPSYSGSGNAGGGGGSEESDGNLYYYYYPEEHSGYPSTAGGDDFSAILVVLLPLLLFGGLALLCIPLIFGTTGGAGLVISTRKIQRDVNEASELGYGDSIKQLEQEVNRLFRIYLLAVESEQCPERISCELGTYARKITYKQIFFKIVETMNVVPKPFRRGFSIMQKAAMSDKGIETCRKYLCHPPKVLNKI